MDAATFVWGAVCQQGTHLFVPTASGRFVVLTAFLATLALFASYSANIVALLQSPGSLIKTVDDLMASPLSVSVQESGYNRFYYTKSNDTILRNLYNNKISPQGNAGWIYDTAAGVERIRTELFAYQVENKAAYKAISRTFSDHEKCSLSELHLLKLPMKTVTVERNFPYIELFKQR